MGQQKSPLLSHHRGNLYFELYVFHFHTYFYTIHIHTYVCVCMYTAFSYILHKRNHTYCLDWNHIEFIH